LLEIIIPQHYKKCYNKIKIFFYIYREQVTEINIKNLAKQENLYILTKFSLNATDYFSVGNHFVVFLFFLKIPP